MPFYIFILLSFILLSLIHQLGTKICMAYYSFPNVFTCIIFFAVTLLTAPWLLYGCSNLTDEKDFDSEKQNKTKTKTTTRRKASIDLKKKTAYKDCMCDIYSMGISL